MPANAHSDHTLEATTTIAATTTTTVIRKDPQQSRKDPQPGGPVPTAQFVCIAL